MRTHPFDLRSQIRSFGDEFTARTPSADDVASLDMALKVYTQMQTLPVSAEEHKQKLTAVRASWLSNSSNSMLGSVATVTFDSYEPVNKLHSVFKQTMNSQKPRGLCDQVVQAMWKVLEWNCIGATILQAREVSAFLKLLVGDADFVAVWSESENLKSDIEMSCKLGLAFATTKEFIVKLPTITDPAKAQDWAMLLMQAYRKTDALVSVADDGSNPSNKISNIVVEAFKLIKEECNNTLKSFTQKHLLDCTKAVDAASSVLAPMQGGAADGKHWTVGLVVGADGSCDVLAHFKATVDKMDTKGIDRHMIKLGKQIVLLMKDLTKYKAFADENTLKSVEATLIVARPVLLNANTTKFEVLCGRTLISSRVPKSKIQEYTRLYTEETKENAADKFCTPLWLMCDCAMK